MATSWGSVSGNAAIDTLLAAYPWIKLHVGAPGSAGTTNAAAETTRKQAAWNAASGGAATNSGTLTWTAVAGSETYTHYSGWTASSAGTFGHSGTVSASAITAGQSFVVAAAALSVSLTLAS